MEAWWRSQSREGDGGEGDGVDGGHSSREGGVVIVELAELPQTLELYGFKTFILRDSLQKYPKLNE